MSNSTITIASTNRTLTVSERQAASYGLHNFAVLRTLHPTVSVLVEAHPTEGGKQAIKISAPGYKPVTKYVVGGYRYYVLSVSAYAGRWERGEYVREPSLRLDVDKRTGNVATAHAAARKHRGFIITNRTDGTTLSVRVRIPA